MSILALNIKFQIISEVRKEERVSISEEGGGKEIIFITSLMTDQAIKTELTNNERKLNHIRDVASFDLKKQFKHVNISLISDGRNDFRMNYLLDGNDPLLIIDLKGKKEGMDDLVAEHLKALLLKETNPSIRRSLEMQLIRALGDAAKRDIEKTKAFQDRFCYSNYGKCWTIQG